MNYSTAISTVLQFMKSAENKSLDMSGEQKKIFVVGLIKKNLPTLYDEHSLLLEVVIDTLVLISNNPSIIKASSKCFICFK